MISNYFVFLLLSICTIGCSPILLQTALLQTARPISTDAEFPLIVTRLPLNEPDSPCTDGFISHPLDHITQIQGDVVRTFDSNGSGLGINDLDNDGDLDLVLANLAGPNAIFWNQGDFEFRKEEFPHGQSRGVNIVDIDGDGWQDVIFAHRRLRPFVWLNNGHDQSLSHGLADLRTSANHRFRRLEYFNVSQRAYTMAWADMDRDNDLDIVVATYQTEYTRESYLDFGNGGVVYYENVGESFEPTHLTFFSQALALLLVDLDEDSHLDIWVGHDFLLPDQVWFWREDGWQEGLPFAEIAQNTMSFAAGDTNNDGRLELFSADMKPFATDPSTMDAWAPLMETMEEGKDEQILANVLLVPSEDGLYENKAELKKVDATGWSWSSQFGDLDNDGFQDLYVVNGMAAKDIFGHLPDYELVEENQVFRNSGLEHSDQIQFIPMAEWGLNSPDGGRSMGMADLDLDGDLDIVVNNLMDPTQIFENQLCGGKGFEVDLFWAGSKNSRAIGTILTLHTSTGVYRRDIRSASGYLSGSSARVHFGLPENSEIQFLSIDWPDGERSQLSGVQAETLVSIYRLER